MSKSALIKSMRVAQQSISKIRSTYACSRLSDAKDRQTVKFFTPAQISRRHSFHTKDQIRPNSAPEVAFIGRSNVGKSKLINTIAQSAVVHVRNMPGVTRSINVYKMGPLLDLVDMPGYGFAFAKDADRFRSTNTSNHAANPKTLGASLSSWTPGTVSILCGLYNVTGLKVNDIEFLQSIAAYGLKTQLVFTKCDLSSFDMLAKTYEFTLQQIPQFGHVIPEIALVSSKTKKGIPNLQSLIFHLANAKEKNAIGRKLLETDIKSKRKRLWKKMKTVDNEFRSMKRKRRIFLEKLSSRNPRSRKVSMGTAAPIRRKRSLTAK